MLTANRVTSTYLFPFKEDLCRYDFEVDPEDEYMCDTSSLFRTRRGIDTPVSNSDDSTH